MSIILLEIGLLNLSEWARYSLFMLSIRPFAIRTIALFEDKIKVYSLSLPPSKTTGQRSISPPFLPIFGEHELTGFIVRSLLVPISGSYVCELSPF